MENKCPFAIGDIVRNDETGAIHMYISSSGGFVHIAIPPPMNKNYSLEKYKWKEGVLHTKIMSWYTVAKPYYLEVNINIWSEKNILFMRKIFQQLQEEGII